MIHWAEGLPPSEFIEQLRWFAREVMPAFNRAYQFKVRAGGDDLAGGWTLPSGSGLPDVVRDRITGSPGVVARAARPL